MKYTVPDYYNQFACIASECPDTCCAGWQIVIDDKSLKKYKNCRNAFGNRLANSIDWNEKTFLQYDGRCAFLDENNLCDIYLEAGPEMFCRTCRNYPRHIEEFENEREISLSISCPVVAELLLHRTEKVGFVTKENDREETEDESFDFFLYSALQDCRTVLFEILQDRTQPVAFRMAKVLALGHDVQNRINGSRLFEVQEVLERFQRKGADAKLKQRFEKYSRVVGQQERMQALFDLLGELEVLNPDWPEMLRRYRKKLYEAAENLQKYNDKTAVENLQGNGDEAATENLQENGREAATDTEIIAEQLMVYFLFTYFCGAVYDGDAFAKVKMSVVCTLLLLELIKAEPEQMAPVVWKFSRELEHSDQNLNRMEELMNESSAADFEELLRCALW